jgi:hypothetical protein
MYPKDTPPDLSLKDSDIIFAFFIFCYHLKDWVARAKWINKECLSHKKNIVENFINNNSALRYCADICNGIKHFELNEFRRNTEAPRFKNNTVNIEVKNGILIAKRVRFSLANTDPTDALLLASKCMEAWKDFIKERIDPAVSLELKE